MALDNFPKKPCKHCGQMGHWAYACRLNPKTILKRTEIKRSTTPIKRSPIARSTKPINKIGKHAKQWMTTRATWIRKNPPPIHNEYWLCYLQIHEWCPKRLDISTLTLDHVVSRTRDPSLRYKASNLKPACYYCNELKGSRAVDEVKPPTV